MKRRAFLAISGLSLTLLLAAPSVAADFGTAQEAKALLERAVTELKAGETGALAKFNDPKGGFRDRDLYVFCLDKEGKTSAHPSLPMGTDIRALKDKTGKAFGEEMYTTAKEGQVSEVSYMWPRPNTTDPVAKVSYITKVGDALCGVGYYK